MKNRNVVRYKIMNSKTSNGVGNAQIVPDFRHIVVQVSTSGNANLTLKCQGAIASALNYLTGPNFGATANASNPWDYLQIIDLNTGDAIDGDTGIVFSGTDSVQLFEINTNLVDFVNFQISGYTAGAVNIDMLLSNNE